MEEKRLGEVKLEQEMNKNTKLLQENTERDLSLRAKREEVLYAKTRMAIAVHEARIFIQFL